MTQTLLTFILGLVAGYLASYVKFVFDAEKTRFDFKTKILREVWEAVLYAKSLAANLTPESDPHNIEGETQQQRRDRLLPEFYKAHQEAKRIVRFNSPFYPVELHDLSNRILLEAFSEARLFQRTSPNTLQEYWRKSEGKIATLNALTDQLSEKIRREVNRPSLCPFRWLWDWWQQKFSRKPASAAESDAHSENKKSPTTKHA